MAINGSRWIAGWSNLSDGTRHAALWRNGVITDLRTLGGPSSTVPWQGLNDAGMVVGISQTDETDPLDEDWSCELGGFIPSPNPTNLVCRGFVWQNDVMRELSPLGGHPQLRHRRQRPGPDRGLGRDGGARRRPASTSRCSASAPRSGSPSPAARDGSRRASCRPGPATPRRRPPRSTTRGRRSASPAAATRAWAASAPSARFAGTGTASPTLCRRWAA